VSRDDDLDLAPFLHAARASTVEDEADKADVLARLEVTLGLPLPGSGYEPPGGGTAPSSAPPCTGSSVPSVSSKAIAKASVLFLIGAAAGAIGHAMLSPPMAASIARPATVATPQAAGELLVQDPPPAPAATPISSLPSVAASPPSKSAPVPQRARESERPGVLEAERTLLETARTALLRSDHGDALAALDEHRVRFPAGQLTEERESLAIYVLVAAGRKDEARVKAAQFLRAFPKSLHVEALKTLVEGG
jgi:hypothetical protein